MTTDTSNHKLSYSGCLEMAVLSWEVSSTAWYFTFNVPDYWTIWWDGGGVHRWKWWHCTGIVVLWWVCVVMEGMIVVLSDQPMLVLLSVKQKHLSCLLSPPKANRFFPFTHLLPLLAVFFPSIGNIISQSLVWSTHLRVSKPKAMYIVFRSFLPC